MPLLIDIEIPLVTNCGTNVQLKVMRYGVELLSYIVKDVVLAPRLGKSLPEPKSVKPVLENVSTQAWPLFKAEAPHVLFEVLAIDSTGFVLTRSQSVGSKTVVRLAA